MENEPVGMQDKNKAGKCKKWILVLLGLTLCAAFFLGCAGVFFPIQTLFYLAVGWFSFLKRVIPQMMISVSGLVTALLLCVLMAVVIHLLGILIIRQIRNQNTAVSLSRWRLRWTCAVLVLLVISFTGGFAVVGVAHQTSWLFTTEKRVIQTSYGSRGRSNQRASMNNLRNNGLAVVNFASGQERRLPSGIMGPSGQPLHSWETELLPFLDAVGHRMKIDDFQPWNSERNAEYFKTSFPVFIMRGRDRTIYNSKGYGLSYYSLNNQVFYPGSKSRFDQIPDGISNTIMGGEVFSRVRAWGDPFNFRDPALGINKHVDGFGAPWKSGGANMIFLDGSARFISNEIDPQILKALSTPNGGDSVGDFRK
ncbi:DUF1559 domain-containing protein [uncultured Gimesia sp.]|uniref:DUF1559 family PulG-like putative transporter n=1 Tax=uncultured Gimesia sp. TaxID=1678688 RepID=UPI00262F0974|nr:DUF1559 domain-containing protein [uncultured Gimesia sp.]